MITAWADRMAAKLENTIVSIYSSGNSVHANSYTKNKVQEFFFHCYIICCCTELHETCTKHKRRKLPTFLACPLLASSDRNADLG